MADQISWSVSESGIEGFEYFLDHAAIHARDMREPLHDVQDYVQELISLQFASEGAYRSGGWAPLSEDYEKWKRRHAPGEPLLQLPIELIANGRHGTPADEKMINVLLGDGAWDITETDALYAPDSTRAAWHQEGAMRSRGGELPARPVLDLDQEDYDAIENIFERWVRDDVIG